MLFPVSRKRLEKVQSAVAVFVRAVAMISRGAGAVAAVMILVAALVVCQMVFVRYVLGQSTYWQTELVTYLLLGATFIGSSYVLLTRGHVNVDIVPRLLGERGRRGLAIVANTVSFAFCLVVAWTGFELWREAWEAKWLSETVWGPPLWIPYLALPAGLGLLCLQYVAQTAAIAIGMEAPIEPEATQVVAENTPP